MPWSHQARVPQLLSPRAATTTEALTTWSLCTTAREATAVGSPHTTTKSGPGSLQLEKAGAAMKTQGSQKKEHLLLTRDLGIEL